MGAINKPVNWTKRATEDLEKVTKFNLRLYSPKIALDISTSIRRSTEILENTSIDITEYGQIDEQFLHLKHQYRKLINNHCKITYRIGNDAIYIVRVFDTRQHPNKNK